MQRTFLRYGVAAFITIATIASQSDGRELRPSEHGLAHEESASPLSHNGTKEMISFFGSKTTTPSVTLPEADNIGGGDAWWSDHGGGESRDAGRDHVRMVLVVVSAVCGTAGVVLLVVSGIVLLVRRRKREAEAEGGLSSKPEFQ